MLPCYPWKANKSIAVKIKVTKLPDDSETESENEIEMVPKSKTSKRRTLTSKERVDAIKTGKRRFLTLKERKDVIKRLDSGLSCRKLAKIIGCGKTQITMIQAQRDLITKALDNGGRSVLKKKTIVPRKRSVPVNYTRKILTLKERMDVIKKLDSGLSQRTLAEKIGCGKTQISKIQADREEIMKEWINGGRSDRKYIVKRKTRYEDLNEMLWKWFCAAQAKNVRVTGQMVKDKAMVLSGEMGLGNFSASGGWLDSWKRRHNIKFSSMNGSSQSVCPQIDVNWTHRLGDLTSSYDHADVFCCDETTLFFRALPKHCSLHKRGQSRADRVTVLLACSAAGEKLPPLVVGRAENRKCLKTLSKAALPVSYQWDRDALMTSTIFSSWLGRLNCLMKSAGRHVVLFLDRCSSHADLHFSNVKLQFLPPSSIFKLQPLEAGIVALVKALYRKRLLRHVLTEMDDGGSCAEMIAKSISVLDAVQWLSQAWHGVASSTVQRCFQHCGFSLPRQTALPEEPAAPEPQFRQLLGGTRWKDYINMDSDTATSASIADTWDVDIVSKAKGFQAQDPEEEEEGEGLPVMTSKQAPDTEEEKGKEAPDQDTDEEEKEEEEEEALPGMTTKEEPDQESGEEEEEALPGMTTTEAPDPDEGALPGMTTKEEPDQESGEEKEEALPGMTTTEAPDPDEGALPGMTTKEEPDQESGEEDEEALPGMTTKEAPVSDEEALPGMTTKEEPDQESGEEEEEALPGMTTKEAPDPDEEAMLGMTTKEEPDQESGKEEEEALPGMTTKEAPDSDEEALPGMTTKEAPDPDEEALPGMTSKEALAQARALVKFAMLQNHPQLLSAARHVESLVEDLNIANLGRP